MRTIQTSAFVVAMVLCSGALPGLQAREPSVKESNEFPYVIQPELGAAEYAAGDAITITSLRGNRPHLKAGGVYVLEGSYTLASAEEADLAWFATSRGASSGTPISKDEHILVRKGSGTFRLKKKLLNDGWLHVSFYAKGDPHGGVYFGEKGVEKTILREKTWSDFSNHGAVPKHGSSPTGGDDSRSGLGPANRAILAYLGNPVAAPAELDAEYTPEKIEEAFRNVSRKAGLQLLQLAVDDSEFPFLVYGLFKGRHEYRVLESGLRSVEGYVYGGSVVGTTEKKQTYFSLNIIPFDQFPVEQATSCNRRLMVRLQMLADRAQHSQ